MNDDSLILHHHHSIIISLPGRRAVFIMVGPDSYGVDIYHIPKARTAPLS